jgi:hypothetical protein
MLYDKRGDGERVTPLEAVMRSSISFFRDLRPYIFFQFARLIVWRTLFARRFLSRKQKDQREALAGSRRTMLTAHKKRPQPNGH